MNIDYIKDYGEVIAFNGAFSLKPKEKSLKKHIKLSNPTDNKVYTNVKELIKKTGLKSGDTISFHHHLRNGDKVVGIILQACEELGINDLKLAISAIFPTHDFLVEYAKKGIITQIDTNYCTGKVANAISRGEFKKVAIFRTHGGRARAIYAGDLEIDVAFIAASATDNAGNINGTMGKNAFGSIGYAIPDADFAKVSVAVSDTIYPYPLSNPSITQDKIDYVLMVDEIGDPNGIKSGTTDITKDPIQLKIAKTTANLIDESGLLKDGFSFQTGAGGISLASAHYVKEIMKEKNIKGSFIMGGITAYLVSLYNEGYFNNIFDVQGFDLEALKSLQTNPNHYEVSSSLYANIHTSSPIVNRLDCVVLGATEVDTNFNTNVMTSSNGYIMGGSGGHSDAAAGAKLAIITTNLIRTRKAIVKEKINSITTPGESINALVCEYGIALNDKTLAKTLKNSRLKILDIKELASIANDICGVCEYEKSNKRIVAVVEYRDGSVIDVIRQV